MKDLIFAFKEYIAGPFREADKINRQVIIDYLHEYKINSILEIGPGQAPLIENIDAVQKIVIDRPQALDYCRSLGYLCLGQDAGQDKWQLDDQSIDVIVSNQCLEHIPNTDYFISEVNRVLKDNGLFLVSVPNQGALMFIVLLLLTINPPMNFVSDRIYMLGNPLANLRGKSRDLESLGYGHLRLFSTRAMNDLLRAYGFKILKNHGGSWGAPIFGRFLGGIFPYYGLYTTVLAQKRPVIW